MYIDRVARWATPSGRGAPPTARFIRAIQSCAACRRFHVAEVASDPGEVSFCPDCLERASPAGGDDGYYDDLGGGD